VKIKNGQLTAIGPSSVNFKWGEGREGAGKTNFFRNMVGAKKSLSKRYKGQQGQTIQTNSPKFSWN